MQNKIFRDFELHFPLFAKDTVDYIYDSEYNELTILLQDGSRILFDGYDCSIRNLPDYDNMSDEDIKREFGRRLRRVMERKCVRQEELSEITGIPQSHISMYVNGRVMPTYPKVYKIARALGCSMDDFGYC